MKERIAASKGARRSWLEIEYGWKYRMSEFDRDERRWYQRHRHSFNVKGRGRMKGRRKDRKNVGRWPVHSHHVPSTPPLSIDNPGL